MISILRVLTLGALLFSSVAYGQCEEGQVELMMTLDTDGWGYENYWEIVPSGNACGDGAITSGGNSDGVGCSGDGDVAGSGGTVYDSNIIFQEGPFCLEAGVSYDLIFVDSYGDGGLAFEMYFDGLLAMIFYGSGYGNTWTFVAGESLLIDHDSPCGAMEIEVGGAMALISNSGGTVANGEPAPGPSPIASCGMPGWWCTSAGWASTSVWLSFVAGTTDPLTINACTDSTTFDTQLACYHVTDCGDWSTFELVGANDDIWGGCGPGNGYSSRMYTSCLEAGELYLIQLDGWNGSNGQAGVEVFVTETPEVSLEAAVQNMSCALGKEDSPYGAIQLYVVDGGSDMVANWIGPDGFSGEGAYLNGLSGGDYAATVMTACGTFFSYNVEITEAEPISISTSGTDASCDMALDGSIMAEASGGTGDFGYVWNGPDDYEAFDADIDGLAPGTYQLTVIDGNNCDASSTVFLDAGEALNFSLGSDTIICKDEALLLNGPAGLVYEWQDGSVNQFYYVEPYQYEPGTYSVILTVTNDYGCEHTDAMILTVHDCTLEVGSLDGEVLMLYPNPASSTLQLSGLLDAGSWTVSVLDAAGRVVLETTATALQAGGLDVSGLAAGSYVLDLQHVEKSGVLPVRVPFQVAR